MSNDLFAQTTTPTSEGNLSSGGTNWGNRFSHATGITVDKLWWYRKTLGFTNPTSCEIWDTTTGTSVVHSTLATDDGTVGWHSFDLAPTALTAGHDYVASIALSGGDDYTGWSSGPPAPGAGYTVVGVRFGSGYPTTVGGYEAAGVSVGNSEIPGSAGTGDPVLTGDLAAWLSGDDTLNIHHDDLPWRTDANVSALKTLSEGSNGLAAIKGAADTIATSVGSGLHTAVTSIGTTLGTVNTNVTTLLDRWSASLATALQTMSDNFATFFNTIGGTAGGPTGALSGRSGFPTELWTLAAEGDFENCVAITEPAELYVVSITSVPHGKAITTVCGVDLIFRAGWWSQLNGSFATQRQFLDYVDNHLVDGGRRMPGALIALEPDGAGHWQAWRLT